MHDCFEHIAFASNQISCFIEFESRKIENCLNCFLFLENYNGLYVADVRTAFCRRVKSDIRKYYAIIWYSIECGKAIHCLSLLYSLVSYYTCGRWTCPQQCLQK